MTQQILVTKFLESVRPFGAALFILVLFSGFKTETAALTQTATPETKKSDEISLDYHPWQPGLSTFVVVREDGSVKLVRYDRHHLTVSEHKEGVLAPADVAKFFATIRKPSVRRALRLRKRYTRDWGDADLFYLTSRTASDEQAHWFSMGERALRTIFLLVDEMLSLNTKLKSISPGSFDGYLRAEKLTPQDTKAVLEKGRPFEIGQFPSALQEVIARAVAHPKEFFLITAEQAVELERTRKSILQHARSVYDLQLFDSLLVPPGKPILIKEPPNEDPYENFPRVRTPPRFERSE